ncbi:MAG: universal stress protein [Calditrichaeota bacterium]|nr:MAG: universal stress protein [Calditrichota bacterium]
MKKILLILSFLRSSRKTIDEAIQLAKEKKAELLVFFVLDIEYADRIVDKLTDEGWISGKPTEQLYNSLLKEYKIQAENIVAEIEARAAQLNIPVRSVIRRGTVLDETLRITDLEEPDLIVVTRRKRSGLSRLIFGSLVKTLQKHVDCEVKIIDEE